MSDFNTLGQCDAIIQKIQTTADGGIRLTLDLGHDAHNLSAILMQKKLALKDLIHIVILEKING